MNWNYQIIRTLSASLLILCCIVISLFASCSVGKTNVASRKNITCINQERDALLKFKHHIQTDYCGLLSSWGNPKTPDCCTWEGVTCSSKSGHVIGLHLSEDTDDRLRGCLSSPTFSPSLGELKHLKYLDLSKNSFYEMDIPSSIGTLVNLVYLNLSACDFSGNISDQLGNLTRLTSLDLSNNGGLFAKSLNWLSRLTLLREINLVGTNLSKAKDWSQSIGSLPLLEVLKMDGCKLPTPPPSSFLQSPNLRVISLSRNNFRSSSSFQWLFNTSNYSSVENQLKYLDLSYNSISGPIPDAIGYLKLLTYLDLSQNSLSSTIPDVIGNIQSLMHMDLSSNLLSGSIPSTLGVPGALGMYSRLSYLDLSNNRLEGPIPDSLASASSLSHLDLSYNQLEANIPASMANLKHLDYLDLSSNNLRGNIPCRIGIEEFLNYVNFSYNNLSGSIPEYYWSMLWLDRNEAFQGNPNLRMDEFKGICEEAGSLSNEQLLEGDEDDEFDNDQIYLGLYVSIVLGFYTGFWVFCGTLTLKNSWRHAYFRFLDHILDKIYVVVAVYSARFRRNSQF